MKKKKILIITGIVLILAAIIAAVVLFCKKSDKDTDNLVVYVTSVSDITGSGYAVGDRFMGVVETQETQGVDKADDRTVKEIYVSVGDEVKKGDKLFAYDTDEMSLKQKQLELELSSINNNISTLNSQIASLNEEKKQVDENHKIEYTSQIQSLQAQVNQENYNASAKQLEIDRQKTAIENAIVVSPMDGIIKEINNGTGSPDSYGDYGNTPSHFISIMDMGEYKIKASVSEYSVGAFSVGARVVIYSRVDESKVWYGKVTKIDTENANQGSNDYYYSGGTQATKYPVYIALDSSKDIMLGQHVYVELDYGQGEIKEGLWLADYYIVQDRNAPYVWAENNGKLERRTVELGEYDEEMCTYEILSGISEDDYIAFPEDNLKEGTKTTHNYEDVIDNSLPDDDSNIDFPDGEDIYPKEEIYPEGDEVYPEGEEVFPESEDVDVYNNSGAETNNEEAY